LLETTNLSVGQVTAFCVTGAGDLTLTIVGQWDYQRENLT